MESDYFAGFALIIPAVPPPCAVVDTVQIAVESLDGNERAVRQFCAMSPYAVAMLNMRFDLVGSDEAAGEQGGDDGVSHDDNLLNLLVFDVLGYALSDQSALCRRRRLPFPHPTRPLYYFMEYLSIDFQHFALLNNCYRPVKW